MNKDQDELIWLSQREVLMIDDRDYVSKMMQNDRDFWVPELARIFALLLHDIKDENISDRCKNISQASDIYLKQGFTPMVPLSQLIQASENLLTDIIKKLNQGNWLGFIYSTLLENYLAEVKYFKDKMNSVTYNVVEEIQFWNKLIGNFCLIERQMLNPHQTKNDQWQHLTGISSGLLDLDFNDSPSTFVLLSYRFTNLLDTFHHELEISPLHTTMNPQLLSHIIEVTHRSLSFLRTFQLSQDNSYSH